MTTQTRDVLVTPSGYRAGEAGLFVAELDELTARMLAHLAGATPEELAWQPAPGTNTIGMLLAHIAIVEVFWTQVGPLGLTTYSTDESLGIGIDDDGMPVPAGGAPPENLRGKDLAYFADLIRRGREYVKRAAMAHEPADLDRTITRARGDGTERVCNLRWIYYHLVEHLGGHYGQINLLRHLYRLRRG